MPFLSCKLLTICILIHLCHQYVFCNTDEFQNPLPNNLFDILFVRLEFRYLSIY